MRQAFIAAAFLVSAAVTGWAVAPPAWRAVSLAEAPADPLAGVDAQVGEALTPQRTADEIDAALAAEDDALAASFVALAGERGIAVGKAQLDRLAALRAGAAWRTLRDFGAGLATGGGNSGAAMAGALAGDVTGYGDLRDLYKEGGKAVAGQSADMLIVGLAAAGLALSAATWSSAGAALPARGGLTLVKAAQKAGRLSKPLVATLSRAAASAIDRQALSLAVSAAGRLELAAAWRAARIVLRPAALKAFITLGGDVASLYKTTGQRGARHVLALAQSGEEVTRAAKLAVAKGGKTRAILNLLGRGALVAVVLSWTAAGWVFSFVWYLFGLALLARRFGVWLGRKIGFGRNIGAKRNTQLEQKTTLAPALRAQLRRSRVRFPGIKNDAPLLGV